MLILNATSVISQNDLACSDRYPDQYMPTYYGAKPRVYTPAGPDTSSQSNNARRLLESLETSYLNVCQSEECAGTSTYRQSRNLQSESASDGTVIYLIFGDSTIEISDNFYEDVQKKMNAYDDTAIFKDITFKINTDLWILNYPGGFPSLLTTFYYDQISSLAPAFPNYPPVRVVTGDGWIALTDLALEDSGWVYGVISNYSQNAPNTIQIRNGVNMTDKPVDAYQSIEFRSGELSIMNFTDLLPNTTYYIHYYSTNEDLSPVAVTSEVRSLSAKTTGITEIAISGSILKTVMQMGAIVLCILFAL